MRNGKKEFPFQHFKKTSMGILLPKFFNTDAILDNTDK